MHSRNKGITVVGTGTVNATPDLVTITIGVTALAPTVAEATASAARSADQLLTALADSGISGADRGTTQYHIGAEYDWSQQTRRFTGFRVSNSVYARTRDLEKVGEILDSAVAATGDAITVNGLTFSIEDPGPVEVAARDAAFADARATAEQLAGLAGRSLGKAVSITETHPQGPPAPLLARARMADMESTPTPIEAGSTTVSVSVQVRFEFDD